MKQKIEQLAKGIFEYKLPEILLSVDVIRISVEAGTTFQGSFVIRNSKGSHMKGVLYSSSRLFKLENDVIIGEVNTVNFKFIADYVNAGETINGEVSIVSDCGETMVPFEAVVEPPYCKSSIGVVKDLFQFANLAKLDWLEAKQLFHSEAFSRAIEFYDKKFAVIYRHLLGNGSDNRALEEFLVAIHKKLPITFTTDKSKLEYNAGQYSFLDKIILTKNTWGYEELHVDTDAQFIRLEKKLVLADNFIANTCEIGFVIEPENMRQGNNFGEIVITGIHQKIVIPVVCRCVAKNPEKRIKEHRKKQHEYKITNNYIKFRMNKISAGKYIAEAENELLGINSTGDEDTGFLLYQIHLQLIAGKEANAKTALETMMSVKERYVRNDPVTYAALLYLEALYKKQPSLSATACEVIRDIYKRYPEEWILLWFLLYIDKHYEYSKQQKFDDIKEQFSQGCHSPVMYYEAAALINEEPSVLRDLTVFEIQVVYFAVKRTFITKEAAMQYAYLAGKEKEFNILVFNTLCAIYERFPDKELLTVICGTLVKGELSGKKYSKWYEHGVVEQVRVQELHEYYIMSVEEDINLLLPHPVLSYFAYNSSLCDEKRAFLYANVITNSQQYGAVYESYVQTIEEFALEMLNKGAVSRNLAVIYDSVLTQVPITTDIARLIPEVAFSYELECSNKNVTEVIIVHKELNEEVHVPVIEGNAFINIFTENAEVILVDSDGSRYISTIDYTVKKLLHLETLFQQCYDMAADNYKLLLNMVERVQYYQKFDESAIDLRKRVARIPGLNPEYVKNYIQSLIYYYYDNYEGEILESYLMQVDLRAIDRAERVKMIEFMIIRDLYNVALKAMDEFGFEGIDVKRLVKLCSRLILNAGGMEKVEVLVAACHHVFKAGKYDETILKYLVDYYFGTTADMFELWKAAKSFDIDTLDLEERLLGQMLFAESYIGNAKAVFTNYYRSGCNRKLIRAYLSYYAYKYLLNDRIVEPELFDIMKREINVEENDVCLLAILKWYSRKEMLTDPEVNFVDTQLQRMEQKNLVLPFFKSFKGNMRIPQMIYDKYYVEYRTDPKNKVVIHYAFEDNSAGYTSEEMKDVCYGIFVKEFILFCNESLQYYITETSEDEENITESTEVRITPEQAGDEETEYYQLNMIIAAREMHDEKTALKLMENYVKCEYAISQLFHPL